MLYIGLDLGTSSVKGLLVDNLGNILREESEMYSVSYPFDGWSEQNPEDWMIGTRKVLTRLSKGYEEQIKGLSVGGQMHGLVLLDKDDKVIRPAILWNDGRTQKQTDYLNNIIGKEKLSNNSANIAFAGFTAPKILWVKENEPQNFSRITKICLPKDYVSYMLTGVFSTDYSDASGMLLLDVKNKCWSKEMCEICSVKEEWLPKLFESYEITGKIKKEFNLPNAILTAGAGDNAAAAIGTGTVNNGDCNISLGTSGTIFISQDNFSVDIKNALHSFDHANGKYHLMGCILSAASCNKWWIEDVLSSKDYSAIEGKENLLGDNNVIFLPYLMGERSPHNDVNARGAFIGMRPDTSRIDMSMAIMEGVAFALKDCLEIARENVDIRKTKICGGGAKNLIWREIIANVLNVEVSTLETEQGPSYGAAILAMVANKEYATVSEACEKIVKVKDTIKPNKEIVEKYQKKYEIFKKLYINLKDVYAQW